MTPGSISGRLVSFSMVSICFCFVLPDVRCCKCFLCNNLQSPVCLHVEALFGRAPFASKSYSELVEKIRSNQPVEVMNMLFMRDE